MRAALAGAEPRRGRGGLAHQPVGIPITSKLFLDLRDLVGMCLIDAADRWAWAAPSSSWSGQKAGHDPNVYGPLCGRGEGTHHRQVEVVRS